MPITTQSLKNFIEVYEAVRSGLAYFEVPEKSGVACAKGTMTSRLKVVETLASELEKRDANAKDRSALDATLSTLKWLATDTYVTRDFVDVDLPIPPTTLSKDRPDLVQSGTMAFEPAMAMLIKTLESQVLAEA